MAHLKHSGAIRQAAHAKRTALVEIYSDEAATNEPTFAAIEAEANAEARRIVADRAEPTAEQKVARDYERALDAQMQRQGATS